MHQCPTCGKHLEESVRFCPDDGTQLTDTAASSGHRTPMGQRPLHPHAILIAPSSGQAQVLADLIVL